MRKPSLLPVIPILAALAGGCASTPKPYVADPARSEAMNVLIASGIVEDYEHSPIKDAPRVKLSQGVPAKGGTNAVDAAFATTNLFNRPPGVSLGVAGAMSVLSLLSLPDYPPVTRRTGIAWVPATEANSAEDAQNRLVDMMETAVRRLKEDEAIPGITITHVETTEPFHRWGVGTFRSVIFNFTLHDHLDAACQVGVNTLVSNDEAIPAYTGVRSYQLSLSSIWGGCGNRAKDIRFIPWPELKTWREFTARLPDWVYLYFPPSNYQYRTFSTSEGTDKPIDYPVVLNQGRALYFIAPGSGDVQDTVAVVKSATPP